jgi:hypothetical protein
MELIIRPFAPEESALFYSDSEKYKEFGCIGHLRGDFGSVGKEFWSTWWEHQSELKTQEFKDEFDDFINSLRKQGLLKDRHSMADCCYQHPEAKIPGAWHSDVYGFCVNTDRHRYFVRCFPHQGDYNFYVYCYKKQPERLQEKPEARQTAVPPAPKKKKYEPER